ncbi:MAG: methyl-accepting chemotaxis protein [Myxococcota bacterium]
MSSPHKETSMFSLDTVGKKFLYPTIALLVVLLGALGAILVRQNAIFGERMISARAESMADFLAKVGKTHISYFNLQELDNLVDQATKDRDIRYVAFLDDKGKVLTQRSDFPAEPADSPELLRFVRDFTDADNRPMGSMKLVFSRETVERHTRESVLVVLGGVSLTLVLFIVGMLLVTRSLLRPIHELTRATNEVVTKGDLRQVIHVDSRDEIGQLARAFQDMVSRMREALGSLQSSSQALDGSVAELTAANQQQSETLTRQAAAIQETQVTTQEIKQTSLIAAEKAESVLKVMERADEISQRGEAAVEKTVAGLREMRDHVMVITEKIGQLGNRAQQIADITQTVKDLADQSNMLALNAAIEAARGGEHGKGFGVVAREIRSLADQSVQATGRVRDILADITNAIREAVNISQQGSQRIELGLVEVNSSGESVRQLAAIVRENSGAARQIASAVSQQNAGISQIFTAVNDLSKMMDDSLKRLDSATQASNSVSDVSRRSAAVVKGYTV